jgi:hypothetical protein
MPGSPRDSYYPRTAIHVKFVGCRITRFAVISFERTPMAKPHRVLKKANHGSRPANSKARRLKRKQIKT